MSVAHAYPREITPFVSPNLWADRRHQCEDVAPGASEFGGGAAMSLGRIAQRGRRGRPPRHDRFLPEVEEVRPGDPLPVPVDRDNCPRCNVRFDIGCRHRRARLSMGAW